MANKSTKKSVKRAPSASGSSDTKVTRITASDKKTPSKKVAAEKAPTKKVSVEKKPAVTDKPAKKVSSTRRNPLAAIGGYFKGAWAELRQVRWPDRRATWSMTGALIAFTLCFVVVILLLDALFQYLFSLVVK